MIVGETYTTEARSVMMRISAEGQTEWQSTIESSYYWMTVSTMRDHGYVTANGWLDEEKVFIRTAPDISSASPPVELPSSIVLHPNYPNPFNATTEITFDLPRAMQTSLKVYDVLGREVAELAGGVMNAGSHTVTFDVSALSSGVYFYRLEAGEFGETRKMVLLK